MGTTTFSCPRLAAFGGLICAVTLTLVGLPTAQAAAPTWWTRREVLNTDSATDHAAATIGQLKHIARKAYDELKATLPESAWTNAPGSDLENMIASWYQAADLNGTPKPGTDYAMVNQGQLKTIAKRFYDLLHAQGIDVSSITGGHDYPWTDSTGDDVNHAAVNLGQLKHVFNFPTDMDGDGIADWWETAWNLNPSNPADAQARIDGRGRTALAYYLEGDDPTTDGPPDPLLWSLRPRLVMWSVPTADGYDIYWDGDVSQGGNIDLERELPDGTWETVATVPVDAKFYHVVNPAP
jgi:hypothetical protein